MNSIYKAFIFSTTSMLVISGATAQDIEPEFSLSASAGLEYDSNLTVDAIDTSSNIGDEAVVLDASAGVELVDNDQYGFSAGYDFFQTLHFDLDSFDMSIHSFNADGRYTVNDIDFGTTLMFNAIGLGGDSFLNITTVRPNVGYLMPNNKVYLTGTYEYQKHSFQQNAVLARNGNRNGLIASVLYIIGEGRTASASYQWTDHNTTDPGFSYTGSTIDISFRFPVQMSERETTVRAGYRYQSRGYDNASALYNNGTVRDDNRHRFTASWKVPISNGFFGEAEIEYLSSNSNYLPVDYSETITTVKLGWEY